MLFEILLHTRLRGVRLGCGTSGAQRAYLPGRHALLQQDHMFVALEVLVNLFQIRGPASPLSLCVGGLPFEPLCF